ncbi:hypothetical protein D9M73_154350 [compost metagenome]
MPGRSPAARARRRDRRRADPRQAVRRRLAAPPRPERQRAGQLRRLGSGDDRQGGHPGQPHRRPTVERHRQAGAALRRAGDPRRDEPGDEADGQAVRPRSHHFRSFEERPSVPRAGLHLLLRHAWRGRTDRSRRREVHGRLPQGHRHRRCRAAGRSGPAPVDLDQALRTAPALRSRPA